MNTAGRGSTTRRIAAGVLFLLPFSAALPASPTVKDMLSRSQERASALRGQKPAQDFMLATGVRLIQQGKPAQAVKVLKEALQLYRGQPSEAATLLALGQAYAAQKERTLSRSAYDELLRRFPVSDLADDAQFGKAQLDLEALPSPADLLDAIASFASFNPLSLDPDTIHHFMGVERGYRLDRIDGALTELEATWTDHPRGNRSPEALLRQAVLEGFLISQHAIALKRLDRLVTEHPSAPEVPTAELARGFLLLLQGDAAAAVAALDRVPPESRPFSHATFLLGLIRSYMLDDLVAGSPYFHVLSRSSEAAWRDLGTYHSALTAFAATGDHEAARKRLAGLSEEELSPRIRTWKRALERTLDSIERADAGPDRKLAAALFWKRAGHSARAATLLTRVIEDSGDSEAAATARMELARMLQEQPGQKQRARKLFRWAARTHPVAEKSLEARWRGRDNDELRKLVSDGEVWKDRAAADLARKVATDAVEKGRLIRQLHQAGEDLAEQLLRRRELADFLAERKRYLPALDLYRQLLPEDPSLRLPMLRLAALHEMERLAPAHPEESEGATLDVTRALEITGRLLDAGEREAALDLLRKASGAPGGLAARVRLLSLNLEAGPRALDSLARVNKLLQETALTETNRLQLLEWKARLLEELDVDVDRALDLYRYLIGEGYRVNELSTRMAERWLARGGFREALSWLAEVRRGPDRGRVAAAAHQGLEDLTSARDKLVAIVTAASDPARTQEALSQLAAVDSERFARAVHSRAPKGTAFPPRHRGAVSLSIAFLEEAQLMIDDLLPGELSLVKPGFDVVADSLVEIDARPGEADSVENLPEGNSAHQEKELREAIGAPRLKLLNRLIGIYRDGLNDPARLEQLVRLRVEVRPGGEATVEDRVELAHALAAQGQARQAFDSLQGHGHVAQVEQALLLEGCLEDRDRAESLLADLINSSTAPGFARARAASIRAGWHKGEALEQQMLRACVNADASGPLAALAFERLGELAEKSGAAADAAADNEAAARLQIDERRGWELGLKAARQWLDRGDDHRASALAKLLLGRGRDMGIPEEAREILTVIAGRQQVGALERSLDLDDPENSENFERLTRIARVQIEMIRDHGAAETSILGTTEQFPDRASDPVIAELKDLLRGNRTLEQFRRRGLSGLLRAGLLIERSGTDHRKAARDYGRALRTSEGRGATALLARLYLARLMVLHLGEPGRAEELIDAASEQPEAPRFSSMISTARQLARRLGAGAADGSDVRPDLLEAASSFHDPLLMEQAIGDFRGQKSALYQVILDSVDLLDPSASVTPLGPGVGSLIQEAINRAPDGEPRGRAHLTMARWKRESEDPESALEHFLLAERQGRGTPVAVEAAAERGLLLENVLGDTAGAADAYRTAAEGHGPYQQIAAARLPLVVARREEEATEEQLYGGGDGSSSAEAYLATARRQARRTGPYLEQAIRNFRTYIRLASNRARRAEARMELADVLVRVDRAREAVETLALVLDDREKGDTGLATVMRMGEILETNLADFEEAQKFYLEVSRLAAPDSSEAEGAAEGLARITTARKSKERAERVGVEESAPGDELATIKKTLLGDEKDPKKAVEALRAQIAQTDDRKEKSRLYRAMAEVQDSELQEYRAAADSYGKAIELGGINDDSAKMTLRLATLMSENLEEPRKAFDLYGDWLKKYYAHPKKIPVMLERARLLEAKLDNAQRAVDVYRNIANAHPRSGHDEKALLRIAYLSRSYFADYLGAVDAYDQIARRFPFGKNAESALFEAARVSEIELGDLDRAVGFYNRLVATYPTSPLANEARNALARIERRRR